MKRQKVREKNLKGVIPGKRDGKSVKGAKCEQKSRLGEERQVDPRILDR